MGVDKNIYTISYKQTQYSYTVSVPKAYKPIPQKSKLRRRSAEEVRASRCSAYAYLIA
ncbi:MAG: hypothetical protein ACOYKR_04545 [Sphingobacterium thalpophilum]